MICCCVGRQGQFAWGRCWGGLSGVPWPCYSGTGLAQLSVLLVFWGRWLLQGPLLRYRTVPREKGGVFNFSNSLFVFAFFSHSCCLYQVDIWFLVRGGEWVEYPYVKECSLKSSIYIRYSLQIHIPYNQDTFPFWKVSVIVGVLLYYKCAVTRFEVPTSFCLEFDWCFRYRKANFRRLCSYITALQI